MAPRLSAEEDEPGKPDRGAVAMAVAEDGAEGFPEGIMAAVVVVGMGAMDNAGVDAPRTGVGTEKAEDKEARGRAATTAWQTRSSSSEIWGAVSEVRGIRGRGRGNYLAGFAVCA